MTDRELLELAAEAAGIECHSYVESELFGRGINIGDVDVPFWNPLDDDGDALRLAVELELDITFMNGDTLVLNACYGGPDKMYNTRRAIVHAAANIARATEPKE